MVRLFDTYLEDESKITDVEAPDCNVRLETAFSGYALVRPVLYKEQPNNIIYHRDKHEDRHDAELVSANVDVVVEEIDSQNSR